MLKLRWNHAQGRKETDRRTQFKDSLFRKSQVELTVGDRRLWWPSEKQVSRTIGSTIKLSDRTQADRLKKKQISNLILINSSRSGTGRDASKERPLESHL